MIEAKYLDSTGRELSTIHTEGNIQSGVFGGAFDFAIEKTAEEIVEYTRANFK